MAIEDFVAEVREGRGGILFIEGGPGSGKTHTLDLLDEKARASGVRVLYAQCSRRETAEPWGVVRQLLGFSLHEYLADDENITPHRLETELSDIVAPQQQRTDSVYDFISYIHSFFVRLASVTPTIIAVDNVPHADPESLRALAFITQRGHRVGLGAVVTAGHEDTAADPTALSTLYWAKTVRIHALAPIGEGQAEEISRHVLGSSSPDLTRLCTQLCGGNPLFYRELLRALHRAGRSVEPVQQVTADCLALLDLRPLAQYVAARTEGQVPGARHMLMSLASLGPVGPEVLASTSGTADQSSKILAHLVRTGTVVGQERLRFAQPVLEHGFRQLANDRLTREDHAEYARALFSAGEPPIRVARHLLHTRPEGDRTVILALRRAAREAMREQDARTARLFLERALGEGCPGTAAERSVTRDLGILLLEHWPHEAADVLRRALCSEARPAHRAALACALAEAVAWNRGTQEGARVLRQARTSSKKPVPNQLISSRYRLVEWATDPEPDRPPEASPAQARACPGSPAGLPAVETSLLRAMSGDRDGALSCAESALTGDRIRHANPGAPPYTVFAALPLIWADQADQAEAALQNSTEDLPLGQGPLSCWTVALHSGIALSRGRAEDSARSAEFALTHLPAEPFGWTDWLLRLQLFKALLASGELDTVREQLGRLPAASTSMWAEAVRGQVEGHMRALDGSRGEAVEALSSSGRVLEQMGVSNPAITEWKSYTALLLAECDQIRPAMRMSESATTAALRWGAPRFIGRARITAGYVLQLNGVPAHHYQRLVGDGLALLERCHDPVSQIVGLLVASRSARAGGNPDRARERLDSCSRIARSVGAWGLEEYANARLEDLGDRVPETACVPARLTDSEWRIAKSVMGGLTNRQVADQLFITLRTVEFHLTNIYRKLSISGRDELREALHQHKQGRNP